MAGPSRDQMLSLLAAANNHGDLAVKLSSLRQVRVMLSSMDPSLAPEVFPYIVELQSSPGSLVRKLLVEVIEEAGLKFLEHSAILMPVLLSFLKDSDPAIACQSIVSGVKFVCVVLEEIAIQLHRGGEVERWVEGMWIWTVRFKDAVSSILFESAPVGTKLLAMKFVEKLVLLFTPDANDLEKPTPGGNGRTFNVSWLSSVSSVVNPMELTSEANGFVLTFLDMLQSANNLPGPLAISVVNCLAAIARKRTNHYATVFSALLEFNVNSEGARGGHASSLQYSLKSAFLGFLRSTHPVILKSREKLVRALRAMNSGEAADQVLRQVDKMIKSQERASHGARATEDDQVMNQQSVKGGVMRKRSMLHDDDEPTNGTEMSHKRIRPNPNGHSSHTLQASDIGPDLHHGNGALPKDDSFDPVDQMITVIAALLAEGERGADSLELLVSQIHPDLLTDIVIANMKHLPKNPPPLTNSGSFSMDVQDSSATGSAQAVPPAVSTTSMQALPLAPQEPLASASAVSTPLPDLASSSNQAESKRDPRRDPRRLDPRRVPLEVPILPIKEESASVKPGFIAPASLNTPVLHVRTPHAENTSAFFPPHLDENVEIDATSSTPGTDKVLLKNEESNEAEDIPPGPETSMTRDSTRDSSVLSHHAGDEKLGSHELLDVASEERFAASFAFDPDEDSPSVSNASASEESCQDLPPIPSYVELEPEQEQVLEGGAVRRIIGSHVKIRNSDFTQTRMEILARIISQVSADDHVASLLREGIVMDYQHQQGHELVMHVLYHLHNRMAVESPDQSPAHGVYERLFIGVAKSLLDTLPASDKSFSRLLGEAPVLTSSAMELLEKICCSEGSDQKRGKDNRDGDLVTQGLGAAWSLILGRPLHRKTCLNIVLKCAIHVQDETRAKAIRLVANKLYPLNYLSDDIEKFAQKMLIVAVDQAADADPLRSGSNDQGQLGNGEMSVSGSHGASTDIPVKSVQTDSAISFAEAQRLTSLYFALCIKKLSLLQIVFDIYARAGKAVKQAIHRHISTLTRALGSSYTELLCILSDAPKGCEHLLMLVIQILTEQKTPSSDLIATVKHLYETKLKDATFLIPVLSSFSKNEVLPIFPQLVNLPLDKFQTALAHILQGSAHTGPALTPAEVLVAIHEVRPEKEGITLKKVTDACSACFEQRTVFTHQVLAKALNQMVDQTPLPLLFMRTVIQSIDAYPTLVDFVMEILSKLVSRQIWKMPKLWVGFLKCVSQTQPHSFPVLLQLPPPQLESALNRHVNLRGSLAAYANQLSVRASLPRSTMAVLGLSNEPHSQQPHPRPAMNASNPAPPAHGVAPT